MQRVGKLFEELPTDMSERSRTIEEHSYLCYVPHATGV